MDPNHIKETKIDGLNPQIAKRWSPRAFIDKEVEPEKINLLFEAARWTASCYNEQPWNYIVGNRFTSREVFDRILSTLVEFNQNWAKNSGLLIISVASPNFLRNGEENTEARYDCGQASANMAIQAVYMGLQIHQMGGIMRDKIKTEFSIPEGYWINSVIAVGYLGDPESLNDEYMKKTEVSKRERKELKEFVFNSKWGETFIIKDNSDEIS